MFQSDGGIQRRNWNVVMIEGANPAAAGGQFRLNSTFASMNFSADYLAIFPDGVELGGVMNAANTGSNLSVSEGGLLVTTSGIGTSLGTVSMPPPPVGVTPFVWEFEVVAMEAGVTYSLGYAASIGFGQDVELTPSTQFPPQAYDCYFDDGSFLYNAGSDFGNPFVVGDTIGFVFEAGIGRISFFHNGVFQALNPVMNDSGFCYVAQES